MVRFDVFPSRPLTIDMMRSPLLHPVMSSRVPLAPMIRPRLMSLVVMRAKRVGVQKLLHSSWVVALLSG